jgi:hypothetical protein
MSPAERQKMQQKLQSNLQDTMEVCDRWLSAFARPSYEGRIPETEEYETLEEKAAPLLDKVAALLAEVERAMEEWDRRSADREAKAVAEAIRDREADRAYYRKVVGY